MGEVKKIVDHYERVAERLPTQFRDKPNIDAFVQAWTKQVQDLEDHLYSIPVNTRLHTAVGVNLDRYGALLGLRRPAGADDDEWFSIIAGKIVARASDATVNSIRKTTEAVTQMYNTNIIEYDNKFEWLGNGYNKLTGDVFVYGYYNKKDRTLSGYEGDLLKAACPITTDVAIFGQHIQYSDSERSLYIPCELNFVNDTMAVIDEGDPTQHSASTDAAGTDLLAVAGTNVESYGDNWENGVLPELGGGETILSVNALDPGFEDFLIQEEDESPQRFNIQVDGVNTNHGIFLEISTSS